MTKIICISGKAQNGKDTSATMFKRELENKGKKVLIIHYADLLKFICKTFFNWDGNKDVAGRSLLQRVGTESVRKQRPDYWVDFVNDIVEMFPNEWDYVIIPDTRFPNELYKWKDTAYETIHVRIQRENFESPLTQEQQQHISETALDNVEYDFLIVNDGSIEDLSRTIANISSMI